MNAEAEGVAQDVIFKIDALYGHLDLHTEFGRQFDAGLVIGGIQPARQEEHGETKEREECGPKPRESVPVLRRII